MAVKITRIQKTKQGRFALFCESGFLFSIDDETMFKANVFEGCELSSAQLDALLCQSDLRGAKDKALSYISLRDHSKKELKDKLKLKFDADTIDLALLQLQELDLINDANFAMHRAKYLAGKNKSTREISAQLSLKGITREDIANAIETLNPSDEEACRALVEKSYLTKLQNGKRDSVIAALARKGFSYGVIKAVLNGFTCEENDENEEYGDYE